MFLKRMPQKPTNGASNTLVRFPLYPFIPSIITPSSNVISFLTPHQTGRITLVSNVALGLFVFMSRFVRRIQQRKNKILQNMMVPNGTASDTFNSILNEAYIQSIAKSWYFFVSAICLASDTAWKRNVGITVSTVASAWPVFKVRLLNLKEKKRVEFTFSNFNPKSRFLSTSTGLHGLII
jgi:hypothetical protein